MKGRLIGPYARQVTHSKLKFWFAFVGEGDENWPQRYEIAWDPIDPKPRARRRPIYDKPPTQASNFLAYKVPGNFEDYPSIDYPRFPGDRIADAAASMLGPEHAADIARIVLTGKLPDEQGESA